MKDIDFSKLLGYINSHKSINEHNKFHVCLPTYDDETEYALDMPQVGSAVYIDIAKLKCITTAANWQHCVCSHIYANVWFFKVSNTNEEIYIPRGCLAWQHLIEPATYYCDYLNPAYATLVSKSNLVNIIYTWNKEN